MFFSKQKYETEGGLVLVFELRLRLFGFVQSIYGTYKILCFGV